MLGVELSEAGIAMLLINLSYAIGFAIKGVLNYPLRLDCNQESKSPDYFHGARIIL